jgi:hypothetical protein
MIHISGLTQHSLTFSCVGSHEQSMLHVWTSVVCVNGLRLTVCVSVNLEYEMCQCIGKAKYIYIILCGLIKQCKFKNIYLYDFTWLCKTM